MSGRTRAFLGIVVGLVLLGLAGCGYETDVGASRETAAGAPVDGADRELVLRIDRSGGFVPLEHAFRGLPWLSVYSDGLVLEPAPVIAIYPGPALPRLSARELTPKGLEALRKAIEDAGMAGPSPDYGQPPIADAPNTTVTVVADGEQFVHTANGLDELLGGDAPGLTAEQRAARAHLADFVRQATDLEALVGPDGISPTSEMWQPDRYRLSARVATDVPSDAAAEQPPASATQAVPETTIASPAAPTTASPSPDSAVSSPPRLPSPATSVPDDALPPAPIPGEPQPTIAPWPLADVELAQVGDCLSVDGATAEAVGELFSQANDLTRFAQGGVVYHVLVRPLLPDEPDCPRVG